MEGMKEGFLSEIEKKVYGVIYDQARKICKDDELVNENLFRGVLIMCDAASLTKHLEKVVRPEEAAQVLKSLIEKKMLREYTVDRYPSFVPFSYCSIRKKTVQLVEMPQNVDY